MTDTHLVLIPSYNTGLRVLGVVRQARAAWPHVWVVVDGSNDDDAAALQVLAQQDAGLRVLVLPHNQGKGAAILHGLRHAVQAGFTHVLTMDADGQHPADHIVPFMAASRRQPAAMILGVPQFAPDAPALRVRGRRVSNWWAGLETGGLVADSLFGFRVYPAAPLLTAMQDTRWMRGFDFDPEAAVRLVWAGVAVVNRPAPVRYFSAAQGGISHFNYLRDNLRLTWMHVRLMLRFLLMQRWRRR